MNPAKEKNCVDLDLAYLMIDFTHQRTGAEGERRA